MNFLFEIKLRQETARKYNPVNQTRQFERTIKRKIKLNKIALGTEQISFGKEKF